MQKDELLLGNIPPQSKDFEAAILGAIMLDRNAFDEVNEILTSECFYDEHHKTVFKSMVELNRNNQPIDLLTVVEELIKAKKLKDIGGAYFVTKLTNQVTSSANVTVHAQRVYEKFLRRELIRVSSEIIKLAYDEALDCFEVLDHAETSFSNIGVKNLADGMISMETVMQQTVQKIQDWKNQSSDLTGVTTGFTKLDMATRGWQQGDLIILAARPSVGKCLGKGTQVMMYDGSLKKVEDVVVGDKLMGDDSKPRNVLSLARGKEMMYNVEQKRAISYRVNESHILSVMSSRNSVNNKHGDIIDIPLKEYISKSNKFQNNWKGFKVAVDFESKKTIIPPYLLGLWLGDGTSLKPEITSPDEEVFNYVKKYSIENNFSFKVSNYKGRCTSFTITAKERNKSINFVSLLKQINVFGNKHIPKDFLINSKENRLQLLAGLIDTDGYLLKTTGYEIIQKDKKLIDQIKYLADTLGFKTTLSKKIGKIKSIGFEGEYFRLNIFGNIEDIPVLIKRKKYVRITTPRDHKIAGLTIKKDKIDDYFGFVIDGNHRFLLSDCTVTHNTAFALKLIINAAKSGKSVAIWSLEMKSAYLGLRMLSTESKIYLNNLQTGNLDDAQMEQISTISASELSRLSISFDEKSGVSIGSLKRKCRRLKKKNNLDLVVIDYLQLMSGDGNDKRNREQEISRISRQLKELAQELEVPIIALSQLSRDSGEKNVKWEFGPPLSSLRESGAIEQDADIVVMLWSPTDDDIARDNNLQDKRKARIAKQRNGVLLTQDLQFISSIQDFKEYEEDGVQYFKSYSQNKSEVEF